MSHRVDGLTEFTRTRRLKTEDASIPYDVAGEIFALGDEDAGTAADLYAISYTARPDDGGDRPRPVTFAFNGGPLAASHLLHIGGLGPRAVAYRDEVITDPTGPLRLEDNPDSVLDVTDLVFVDPVNTGYSRMRANSDPAHYASTETDSALAANLVRAWLRRHRRWNSPVYLLGESYGSMRAATMVPYLDGTKGEPGLGEVALSGVVLVGQAVDMSHTSVHLGNDLAHILYVPTMAATAWFHGLVEQADTTLEKFVADARAFASTDLISALVQGNTLPRAESRRVAEVMASFTGLRSEDIVRHELKISRHVFASLVLRDRGSVVSHADTRYTTPAASGEHDPFSVVFPVFARLMNDYLASELQIDTPEPYRIFFRPPQWDWNNPETDFYLNYAGHLADGMRRNPGMRVHVVTGLYDLLTPPFSAEHMVSHSGMPVERVSISYHHGGHMNYADRQARRTFGDSVRRFVSEGARG